MLKPPEENIGKTPAKGTARPSPKVYNCMGDNLKIINRWNHISKVSAPLKNYRQSETAMEWKQLFDNYTSDMSLIYKELQI